MKAPIFGHRVVMAPENAWAAAERAARAHAADAGQPFFDLTSSNPTEVGLPYPAPALAAALARPSVARYQPHPLGLPSARAAVADECRRFGVSVSADSIVLTSGSSEAYSFLFKLLCDPGDIVLVPTPSYPLFGHLAAAEGVALRPYRLFREGETARWSVDETTLSDEALAQARAVVVVSPNNPTGSLWHERACDRLLQRAASLGVPVIVDEVFADYSFTPLHSAADDGLVKTVWQRPLPGLVFALGGLSKSCGLPQMKLGWLGVGGPKALVDQALARLELLADTYLSVGTPVQVALAPLLALGRDVRAAINARLAANRAHLTRVVATPSSALTLLPSEGGWSALLRVPATRTDEAWAVELLRTQGVLVQPGYFFELDDSGQGVLLVLSLLTPPAVWEQGLQRLSAFVNA